jgi:predicted phosphodiesterase
MRLAVVADIHGNLAALEAVADDIRAAAPDLVVNLGDCLSGPLQPAETADRLIELGWPTLRGNHDRWLLDRDPEAMGPSDRYAAATLTDAHRAWLAALPALLAPVADVVAFHATPDDDTRYLIEEVTPAGVVDAPLPAISARLGTTRAPLMLFGHSHVPRLVRLGDGTLLINPGSVGLPAYDADTPYRHAMCAGSPHARYALLDRTPRGWTVAHRALPYDWEGAARLAAARDRLDWAQALATGFVSSR